MAELGCAHKCRMPDCLLAQMQDIDVTDSSRDVNAKIKSSSRYARFKEELAELVAGRSRYFSSKACKCKEPVDALLRLLGAVEFKSTNSVGII